MSWTEKEKEEIIYILSKIVDALNNITDRMGWSR